MQRYKNQNYLLLLQIFIIITFKKVIFALTTTQNCLNKMQLIVHNESFFSHIITEINSGHHVIIPSKGNSMLPFIRPSTDEIELSPLDKKSIQKGNIVLAKTYECNYVVHRIEKIEGDVVILRGDGNLKVREYCKKSNILAEVTTILRNKRKIKKNNFSWKLYQKLWFSNPLYRRIYLGLHRRLISYIG